MATGSPFPAVVNPNGKSHKVAEAVRLLLLLSLHVRTR